VPLVATVNASGVLDDWKTFTSGVLTLAEQFADVPLFMPVQLQLQGPVPVTVDDMPVVQRLVVGIDVTDVLLAEPQAPLMGVGGVSVKVAVTVQLDVMAPVV
jgi:hypothetical protein